MPPKRSSPSVKKKKANVTDSLKPDNDFDIYKSMLAEVDQRAAADPPLKRRKTAASSSKTTTQPAQVIDSEITLASREREREHLPVETAATRVETSAPSSVHDEPQREQVVYDDSDSSSEESDLDFDDYLGENTAADSTTKPKSSAQPSEVAIVLDSGPSEPSGRRGTARLPSSAAEKKKRIDIHKTHLLCLLVHNHLRNCWINDDKVQTILKPLLTPRMLDFLHPDSAKSQYMRSDNLKNGLEQVSTVWRGSFQISARGLRKARWSIDVPSSAMSVGDSCLDKHDFIEAARHRRGTRDEGAQLFCALLRAANIDTRLVCSLQPLPFEGVSPSVTSTPSKPTVHFDEQGLIVHESSADETDTAQQEFSNAPPPATLRPIKRFGDRTATSSKLVDLGRAPISSKKRKRIVDSMYPVYWVEAFDSAMQKWIPVDPLVTKTIAKPSKFEPPMNDALNDMTYVLAFDSDLSAKDVTRRYAKAYNAKTRKSRIDVTKGGPQWWKRVMKSFEGQYEDDRDQVEDAELARKEASEPMPRNIQDFKNHPHYALERHLRHNEVIHPKRQAGKLAVGKSGSTSEPIYRRSDVQIVRSSDKWYRSGREIRLGEQPLRYGKARRRARSVSQEDEAVDAEGVGLYAEFQTDLYVPPPVVRGKVPRNHFGNLDVYVPSMIPPGAAHVRSSDAKEAAKIARIDFVEAVTGFQFKGRKGTAIIRGVVVAKEHVDAIEEIIRELRAAREEAEAKNRTDEALGLWKRFLKGLRIRERVMKGLGPDADAEEVTRELEEAENDEIEYQQDGGFFIDPDVAIPEPSAPRGHEENHLINADPDINELLDGPPTARKKHFWESTLFSPWDEKVDDAPAMPRQKSDLELFGDFEEGGGFIKDDEADYVDAARSVHASSIEGVDIVHSIRETETYRPDKVETSSPADFRENSADSPQSPDDKIMDDAEISGGGFMVEEDGMQAEEEEQEEKKLQPSTLDQEPQRPTSDTDTGQDKPKIQTPREQLRHEGTVSHKPTIDDDEDIASDAGSLLSHDPDDDDVEPEWLADEATL